MKKQVLVTGADGFTGRYLVEALSRGRPLAATAHGGPLDAVADGENGVLFPATSTGLVEALDRLSTADLEAMGHVSRSVYATRFHPDRVLREHLDPENLPLDAGPAVPTYVPPQDDRRKRGPGKPHGQGRGPNRGKPPRRS